MRYTYMQLVRGIISRVFIYYFATNHTLIMKNLIKTAMTGIALAAIFAGGGGVNSAIAQNVIPDRPGAVMVEVLSVTSIRLTWTTPDAGSSPITHYVINRAAGANPAFSDFVELPNLAATDTTFTDINLTPNTVYRYILQAVSDAGVGLQVDTNPVTTETPPEDPADEMPTEMPTEEMTDGDDADNTAATEAILPGILRQQHRGIHNSIFNRILQRQREDGKWK